MKDEDAVQASDGEPQQISNREVGWFVLGFFVGAVVDTLVVVFWR
jgi:hypothetical protein